MFGTTGSLESVALAMEVRASVLTSHSEQQHLVVGMPSSIAIVAVPEITIGPQRQLQRLDFSCCMTF